MLTFKLSGKTYEASYNAIRDLTIVRDIQDYNGTPQLTIDEDDKIGIDAGWIKARPESIELAQFLEDSNIGKVCRDSYATARTVLDLARKVRRYEIRERKVEVSA